MDCFAMFALLFLLALPQRSNGYCYTRNGTTITSPAYQPCNNATVDSTCCGINHSGAGDVGVADDVCEASGLCQNFEAFDGNNEGQQLWWRGGCTDPTWESPYCLKDVCNGTEYADDNAPVNNCGGNSWCCGDKSCCDKTTSIFQLAATVGPTSTTSSETSTPTSSGATTASPTTALPTNSPSAGNTSSTGGLSTAAKAGIGVGAVVLAILIVVVAALVIRLNKSKKGKHGMLKTNAPYMDAPMGVHEQKYGTDLYAHDDSRETVPFELGERPHAELAASREPQELNARGGSVRGHS